MLNIPTADLFFTQIAEFRGMSGHLRMKTEASLSHYLADVH